MPRSSALHRGADEGDRHSRSGHRRGPDGQQEPVQSAATTRRASQIHGPHVCYW